MTIARTPLSALEILKWRLAYQKLVRKDTECPMVNLLIVVLMFDHFRREIVERST